MDTATQTRKWRKFRLSKFLFPTRVVQNGNKGELIVGRTLAKHFLKKFLGNARVDAMVTDDSRGEWIFKELL